jgi:peptidoglycan/LPS O-acetylase OafA/YrhL
MSTTEDQVTRSECGAARTIDRDLPTSARRDTFPSAAASSDPGGFAHLPPLDGIRGLAIGLILVHHHLSANNVSSSRLLSVAIAVRESLWVGVDLFFVLSGFLITGILFDALASPHLLRNFYGRRCVRIVPLYYLALAVLGLMSLPFAMRWNGAQWLLLAYLQNTPLWIGHAIPHPLADFSGHLWSLALEEQFYLAWPLLVLLLRDRRRLMRAALLLSAAAVVVRILLVTHGASFEYTYKMLPCRMDALLLGSWFALALRGPERAVLRRCCRPVFLAASLLLFGWALDRHGLLWQKDAALNAVGYTLIAIAAVALIGMSLDSQSRAGRLCSSPRLRLLGRYSYGIYVWHMILGGLAARPVPALAQHFVHGKLPLLLIGGAAAIVFSILLGVASYHLFEVHFLRLKRYFAYGR